MVKQNRKKLKKLKGLPKDLLKERKERTPIQTDRDVTPRKKGSVSAYMNQYEPTKSNPAMHDKMIFPHLGKRNYGSKI